MEKSKVSSEIANAMDYAKRTFDFKNAIEMNIGKEWGSEVAKCLNDLEPEVFANLFINGWEIEETPEENILSLYNTADEHNYFGRGYRLAVRQILRELDIKIKGIND